MGQFLNKLPNGIITLTSNKSMSDEDVDMMCDEYTELITNSAQKVKVLTDGSRLSMPWNSTQRIKIANTIKVSKDKIEKSAIFGMSAYISILFKVVCHLAGREDIKSFKTRDEALNWLAE